MAERTDTGTAGATSVHARPSVRVARMPQTNLVRQTQEGSSRAFGELYRLYHKRLYAYACVCLRSSALAEEAVQDTALTAWRHAETLRGEQSFEKWLFKILANRCRTISRAESRFHPLDAQEPDGAVPDSLAISRETRDALDRLTGEEREIVMLCVLTGLSGRQAAEALNMKQSTLRSKRSRVLAKIRKYLEN